MDMTEFAESEFVTSELIESQPNKQLVAVIFQEPTSEMNDKFKKKQARLLLQYDDGKKVKTYNPSIDAVQNMNRSFGTDSKAYIGKKIMLSVINIGSTKRIVCQPIL